MSNQAPLHHCKPETGPRTRSLVILKLSSLSCVWFVQSVWRTNKYIYIFPSHHTNIILCAIILKSPYRVTCDFWKKWFGPHHYCLWLQDGIAGRHGYRLCSAKISMNQLREPTAETGWESILWRVQQSSSRPAWSHNLTEMTDRYITCGRGKTLIPRIS